MQKLLGINLDDLEHMLDRRQNADEREADVIDRFDQKLTRKFNKFGRIIPGAEEQRWLINEIDHYLLLSRMQEIKGINFYMRSTFVVNLKPQDLCSEHAAIKKEDLLRSWQHCNDCYLKHSKNKILQKLYTGLNNIIGLVRDLPKTEYRPYVLGLQFVYCVELMETIDNEFVDRQIREFYLKLREVALAVLKCLREMPELDLDKAKKNKTGEVIKSRFMLFNFCGVIPKVVHNATLVQSWHNKVQL